MSASLPPLTGYDGFVALVGQRFTVAGAAGDVALELTAVTPQGGPAGAGRERGFTLVFCGPRASPLKQGTHRFNHPGGTTDIFIVPVALDTDGYRYEAVFNP